MGKVGLLLVPELALARLSKGVGCAQTLILLKLFPWI